jgi:hypothetical protein
MTKKWANNTARGKQGFQPTQRGVKSVPAPTPPAKPHVSSDMTPGSGSGTASAQYDALMASRQHDEKITSRDSEVWRNLEDMAMNSSMPASPAQAEHLARRVHAGQVDHLGNGYEGHLERVVAFMRASDGFVGAPEDVQRDLESAAWLHDSVEDTALELSDIRRAGFSERVVTLVDALSIRSGESRLEYYARIQRVGEFAVTLKLADNADNIDPERRALLPGAPGRPVQPGETDLFTRLGRKYARMYQAFNRPVPPQLQPFVEE